MNSYERLGKTLMRVAFGIALGNLLILITFLFPTFDRFYSYFFGHLFVDLDTVIFYLLPMISTSLMILFVLSSYIFNKYKGYNFIMISFSVFNMLYLLSNYIHLVVNYRP
jgi:hypothetical protein